MVEHFLLHCRNFTAEHNLLCTTLKGSLTLCRLLSDKKAQTTLLTYVQRTKRFPLYFNLE